jgi:hypothetical protein
MAVTKPGWLITLLCGALWAVACDSATELPRVSEPHPTLDADDRAVMRATLDYLRPFRHDSIRRGWLPQQPPQIDARFLVIDATAAACIGDQDPSQSGLPGCVGDHWLKAFPPMADNVRASIRLFNRRNARSLPIRGDLGGDVVLVPVGSGAFGDVERLIRSHPPGSAIVYFSAPVYIDGAAVIAYRVFWDWGGFLRLKRDGIEWKVVDRSGWVE